MNYRAHGDHLLQWHDNNIVVAKLYGTWNEEAANEYGNALKQQAILLKGQPWCRVVDFSGYELHTPEVVRAIQRFTQWAEQNGCIFQCYIFSNVLQREAVKQMLEPSRQQHGSTTTTDEAPTVEDALAKCQLALAHSACASG